MLTIFRLMKNLKIAAWAGVFNKEFVPETRIDGGAESQSLVSVPNIPGLNHKSLRSAKTGFPLHPSSFCIHHSYITSQYNTCIHSSWTPSQPYSYTSFYNLVSRSGAETKNGSQSRLYPLYSGAYMLKCT